jgi:hypothetical protein
MAKVFDEDNVHNFWGLSPSIDVLALLHSLPVSVSQHSMLERLAEADAIHLLQERVPLYELISQSGGLCCLLYRQCVADWCL